MKIFLRRKFDAAHILRDENRGEGWNEEIFGKCRNLHGHTWSVEIEVDGNVDRDTGMVINFNEIKGIVDQFDHGLVNDIVKLPTAENIVAYILGELKKKNAFSYIRVRVNETENAFAEDMWRSH